MSEMKLSIFGYELALIRTPARCFMGLLTIFMLVCCVGLNPFPLGAIIAALFGVTKAANINQASNWADWFFNITLLCAYVLIPIVVAWVIWVKYDPIKTSHILVLGLKVKYGIFYSTQQAACSMTQSPGGSFGELI